MADNMKAFPTGNPEQGGEAGMDLRDWFAGQALQGIMSQTDGFVSRDFIATDCYDIADAMMEARKKND